MKFIFGAGRHLFVWETSFAKAVVRATEDAAAEDFEQVPVDPHGTNGAHMELSPEAVFLGGTRRFGFHGSEGTREG